MFLSAHARQKQKLIRWLNKRKMFVEPMGMSYSKFENETPFLSLAAIIATRAGWDGTDLHIRNRMVSAVEMLGDRFVNIFVPYGTKMLCKPVRETSACFSYMEFGTFITWYAINDVGGGACKIMWNKEITIGSTNGGVLTEKRTCVTAVSRTRKSCGW